MTAATQQPSLERNERIGAAHRISVADGSAIDYSRSTRNGADTHATLFDDELDAVAFALGNTHRQSLTAIRSVTRSAASEGSVAARAGSAEKLQGIAENIERSQLVSAGR